MCAHDAALRPPVRRWRADLALRLGQGGPVLIPFTSADCDILPAGAWQKCADSLRRNGGAAAPNSRRWSWLCDGICVPFSTEAAVDTTLLDDYMHFIGEWAQVSCVPGSALSPGTDTVIANCSLTDGTDFVTAVCDVGCTWLGRTRSCASVSCRAASTPRCLHPGDIFTLGEHVPWPASAEPGDYVAAPCRFGGLS